MKDQMEMLFEEGGIRDDGMNRDPVSGNEIPSGSLATEVRDDIPAQLSEGEYVVPADVVRYYGVKFFEDLRSEAKRGLSQMEADNRIGGQPVEQPSVTDEEMAQLEQMFSQAEAKGIPMAIGGDVGQQQPSQSQFSNPTLADKIIEEISTVIQENPHILREISDRNINVSRINANQTPKQLQKINSPAQTINPVMNKPVISAQAGGSVPQSPTVPTPPFTPWAPGAPTQEERVEVGGGIQPPKLSPPPGGCPKGQMWDEKTTMCVFDPNYRDTTVDHSYQKDDNKEVGADSRDWVQKRSDDGYYNSPEDLAEEIQNSLKPNILREYLTRIPIIGAAAIKTNFNYNKAQLEFLKTHSSFDTTEIEEMLEEYGKKHRLEENPKLTKKYMNMILESAGVRSKPTWAGMPLNQGGLITKPKKKKTKAYKKGGLASKK